MFISSIELMLDQCWASVVNDGPTLGLHWVDLRIFLFEGKMKRIKSGFRLALLPLESCANRFIFWSFELVARYRDPPIQVTKN